MLKSFVELTCPENDSEDDAILLSPTLDSLDFENIARKGIFL